MFIEVHTNVPNLVNVDQIVRISAVGAKTRIVLNEMDVTERGEVNNNWLTVQESYEEVKEKIARYGGEHE